MPEPSEPPLIWPRDDPTILLESLRRYPTYGLALHITRFLGFRAIRKRLEQFTRSPYQAGPSRWLDAIAARDDRHQSGAALVEGPWKAARPPDAGLPRLIWSFVVQDAERAWASPEITDLFCVLEHTHPNVSRPHLLALSFLPRDLLDDLGRFWAYLTGTKRGRADEIRRSARNPRSDLFLEGLQRVQADSQDITGEPLPGDEALAIHKAGWRSSPSLRELERQCNDLGLGTRASAWSIVVIPLVSFLRLHMSPDARPGPYELTATLLKLRYPTRPEAGRWEWNGSPEAVRRLCRPSTRLVTVSRDPGHQTLMHGFTGESRRRSRASQRTARTLPRSPGGSQQHSSQRGSASTRAMHRGLPRSSNLSTRTVRSPW